MSFDDVIATAYPAALLVAWVGAWLFVRRAGRLESASARRALLVAHRVVGALPIAWIVVVAALVARAYARIGTWPHGFEAVPNAANGWPDWVDANIDARSFGAHFAVATALGTAVLWTWLLFPSLHVVARKLGTRRSWLWSAVFVTGVAVWLCVALNADPAGVMEWLDG